MYTIRKTLIIQEIKSALNVKKPHAQIGDTFRMAVSNILICFYTTPLLGYLS